MKLAAVGTFFVVVAFGLASCKSDPPDPPAKPPAALHSAGAVLTHHNDNARTGQNLNETTLAPANVNVNTFGQIGKLPVTGPVDAEPLYVPQLPINGVPHNVVFVATEHGLLYAFDADTLGPPLWLASLIPDTEKPSDDHNCAQVTPEIGITATPVIDLAYGPNGAIFVVAMSKDAAGRYHHRLHALDLVTHAELSGGPVEIQATYPSLKGARTFDPAQYEARSALLLVNGAIYIGWASHCDVEPYTGWVTGYSESTLRQTGVLNLTPNGQAGAIWMSGGGMAADSAGNIFVLDGNGTFDAAMNAAGMPASGDFGNAFLRLAADGNRLRVADYFAAHNTMINVEQDRDLGSGGVLLLPDLKDDSGKTRRLAVGAGKADFITGRAIIYVIDRDAMGKFHPDTDRAVYQHVETALGGKDGVFALPAYFNNTVYYGAQGDFLKAFPIAHARLAEHSASRSHTKFTYPGTTPSVSANGAANGIVWAVEAATPGVLHAYDAANLAIELYNSNQAGGRDQFLENKFITPMIAGGKVFIGTPDSVAVFGLLEQAPNVSRESRPSFHRFAFNLPASGQSGNR